MDCENVKCGNKHDGSFGSGRFCSRVCANSRTWSIADKQKKSESGKSSDKVKAANKIIAESNTIYNKDDFITNCPMCNKEYNSYRYGSKPRVYCSRVCYLDDTTGKFRNFSTGGYRPGSGRGKSGWYRGIWCDSSYELCYLMYCLDHNISITRNKVRYPYVDIEGKSRNYIPDFIINATCTIEIKGYKEPNFDLKIAACPNITVLFKDDLKKEFEYVERVYGKDFISNYEIQFMAS